MYILKSMGRLAATAVAKWGNSTGIRIPKDVAKQAGLREGDRVQVKAEAPGIITVRAVNTEPSLETLLSRITARNRHTETGWGRPKGNEAW